MKLRLALSIALFGVPCTVSVAQSTHRASDTLTPFRSDSELSKYLRRLADEQKARLAQVPTWTPPPCAATITSSAAQVSGLQHAVIRGRLTDRSGTAISHVTVSLGTIGKWVETNSDGRYRIVIPAESLAKPRTVSVLARRVGFDRGSRDLTIRRGDSATVSLSLCPTVMQLQSVVTANLRQRSPTDTPPASP